MDDVFKDGDLIVIGEEPRVFDVRLAEALGFSQPRDIRKLIERWRAALERFGEVSRHRGAKPRAGSAGGRPEEGWALNKKQALFLCTKSETEAATEVTIALVEVFDAWREGRLGALAAPGPRQKRSLANRRSWAEAQAQWWAKHAEKLAAEDMAQHERAFEMVDGRGWVCVGGALVLVDFQDWQVVSGEALVINGNSRVRVAPLARDERGFPAWALHGGMQRAGYIEELHWRHDPRFGDQVERLETVTVLGRVIEQRALPAV